MSTWREFLAGMFKMKVAGTSVAPATASMVASVEPAPAKDVEKVLVRIEWGGNKRRMVQELKKEPLRLFEQRLAPTPEDMRVLSKKLFDLVPQKSRAWKGVVLHHSATNDGQSVDEESITRFHTSWRYNGNIITKAKADELIASGKGQKVVPPWSDCGYNVVVETVDDAVVIFLARPLSEVGGHCSQNHRNRTHIGLCFVGNFDAAPPTSFKIDIAAAICRAYKDKFGFTNSDVERHSTWASYKSCPGLKFDDQQVRIRMNRQAGLAA